jgi:hypothetical protein
VTDASGTWHGTKDDVKRVSADHVEREKARARET